MSQNIRTAPHSASLLRENKLPFIRLFVFLLIGHAVADYPLQRALNLSNLKNKYRNRSIVPWQVGMTAHAASHGIIVGLITGCIGLGIAEFCLHWLCDWAKCEGKISTIADQCVHVACKFVWACIALGYF